MKVLQIIPQGRMGNRMFQYMFAKTMQRRVAGLTITGIELDEWGIRVSREIPAGREPLRVNDRNVDLADLVRFAGAHDDIHIIYSGFGVSSLRHYTDRDYYDALFVPDEAYRKVGLPEEFIVVHVRAEDIVGGKHPDYMPMPTGFIKSIVEETNLIPVFMGQIADDWYSEQLKSEFDDALFLEPGNLIHDFEILRQSRNVLLSVSTFSWLAAWLSSCNRNIYMPVLGFFNPAQRPDLNLMPANDSRYHFYEFPVIKWTGDARQMTDIKWAKLGRNKE